MVVDSRLLQKLGDIIEALQSVSKQLEGVHEALERLPDSFQKPKIEVKVVSSGIDDDCLAQIVERLHGMKP